MKHPFDGAAGVAPGALTDSVLQLHWAAQFLAAAGQTFAEPAADDSHRAMTWDPRVRAFVSTPFSGPYPFRLALRIEDQAILLIDREGEALGTLLLAGRTRDEVYEWLSLGMATYMGSAPPLIERPEYEMPEHAVQGGGRFLPLPEAHLATLASLYGGASAILHDFVDDRSDASVIRCWPHHFDIATLVTIDEGTDEEDARTVGIGLAPSGGGYDEWYWYVTPRPYPEEAVLPDLTEGGVWHTGDWTGAVMSAAEVVALDTTERTRAVMAFIGAAFPAAKEALRKSALDREENEG